MDDKEDDGWEAAQKALDQARRLTGAGRFEALRQAGQLRFDADKRRQKKEEDRRRGAISEKGNRKAKLSRSGD
jgi:ribosomal protein L19E